jgi:hypothetical protein
MSTKLLTPSQDLSIQSAEEDQTVNLTCLHIKTNPGTVFVIEVSNEDRQ